MLTSPRVLLTTRKGCVSVGPRGTEPKSLESSSNSASAHEAAGAAPAVQKPARRTRQYRNMVDCSCCPAPGPLGCHAPRIKNRAGGPLNLCPPEAPLSTCPQGMHPGAPDP